MTRMREPLRRTSTPTTQYYQSRYGTPKASSGSSKYYGSARTTYTPKTSSTPIADPREQNAALAHSDVTDSYIRKGLHPTVGPSALDMALGSLNYGRDDSPSGGRSGGSRGGGGAGAPEGPTPEEIAAMKDYIDSLGGIKNPYTDDLYAGMYSTDPAEKRFDRLGGDIRGATKSGMDRVAGIGTALRGRVGEAGGAIDAALQRGLSDLGSIGSRIGAGQRSQMADVNSILGRFGAGSVEGEGDALARLIDAGRATLSSTRGLYGQAMADRAGVSEQLGFDVGLGMSRDEAALLSQVAGQRDAEIARLTDARTRLDSDLALKRADWQAEQDRALAAARLEAARLGITV